VELLRQVADAVSLPVLRKDFITTVAQVDETVEARAAAVLLTIATLKGSKAQDLYQRALSLGLEPLVEVHTVNELRFVCGFEPQPGIIGINNRDITTLERDGGGVGITEMLAPLVPEGVVILSESAILTADDARRAFEAGAHAVLVGTAILKNDDPAASINELVGKREM
jgi:indole-3-glycerol phosphate synthase